METKFHAADESTCRDFESALQAGNPKTIETYLPGSDDPRFRATLEALVAIEIEFAWKCYTASATDLATKVGASDTLKEPQSVDDYLNRFQELNEPSTFRRLVRHELATRMRWGNIDSETEYISKYPDVFQDGETLAPHPDQHNTKPISDLHTKSSEDEFPDDRYKLLSEKGRGGFGAVWQATDCKLGRPIAIKRLHKHVAHDAETRKRFLNEAKLTARLGHPGVVPVYDMSDQQDVDSFYTMALVHGDTLAEEIADFHYRRSEFSENSVEFLRLMNAFVTVVRTMDYVHSKDTIHRDLKPQNVIVGEFGEAIILDWGLAKEVSEAETIRKDSSSDLEISKVMTQSGTLIGTPAYMSPEQASGENHRIDRRSDIYSLGVILYQLLCGELPYSGNSTVEVLENVKHGNLKPLRTANSRVSRSYEAICMKALSLKPQDRYETAGELADEIQRHIADQPVRARKEAWYEKYFRWTRRNRKLAAAITISLLVLATGAASASLIVDSMRRRAVQAESETGEALQEMEFQYYVATVNRVDSAMRDGNRAQAEALLMDCPVEHRGIEWNILYRRVFGQEITFSEHSSAVFRADFSPDGKWVVSTARTEVGKPSELFVWNAETGGIRFRLQGHKTWVESLAFSDDGKLLATTGGLPDWSDMMNGLASTKSEYPEVVVWDMETGTKLHELKGHEHFVYSCGFVPGTHVLATASYATLRTFDADTAELLDKANIGNNNDLSPLLRISKPDGKLIVNGRALFEVAHGELTRVQNYDGKPKAKVEDEAEQQFWMTPMLDSPKSFEFEGEYIPKYFDAWSRMGANAVVPGVERVKVVDGNLVSGDFLPIRGHNSDVTCVRFSPDNRLVASCDSSGAVLISHWGTQSFSMTESVLVSSVQQAIVAHSGAVNQISFRNDGKRLLSCGADGMVRVWNVAVPQGTLRVKAQQSWGVNAVALSLNGDTIIDQNLREIRTSDGEITSALPPDDDTSVSGFAELSHVSMFIVSPHRKFYYFRGGSFQDSAELRQFDGHKTIFGREGEANPKRATFLGDRCLATLEPSGQVHVYDCNSGTLLPSPEFENVSGLHSSRDGDWLLVAEKEKRRISCVGSSDNSHGYDTVLFTVPTTQEVASMDLSADNSRLAIGSAQGKIDIWDTSRQEFIAEIQTKQLPNSIIMTRDGSRLITLANDRTMTIWHVDTANPVIAFRIGSGFASGLQISNDDSVLAFASNDVTAIHAKAPDSTETASYSKSDSSSSNSSASKTLNPK